jgi:hypothetical protein
MVSLYERASDARRDPRLRKANAFVRLIVPAIEKSRLISIHCSFLDRTLDLRNRVISWKLL